MFLPRIIVNLTLGFNVEWKLRVAHFYSIDEDRPWSLEQPRRPNNKNDEENGELTKQHVKMEKLLTAMKTDNNIPANKNVFPHKIWVYYLSGLILYWLTFLYEYRVVKLFKLIWHTNGRKMTLHSFRLFTVLTKHNWKLILCCINEILNVCMYIYSFLFMSRLASKCLTFWTFKTLKRSPKFSFQELN